MNKLISKLNLKKGQSGFTIIEVLIVLAIGALIILAVLLAVPALQRNQKNSQRKAEAARVAAAVTAVRADSGTTSALTSSDESELATRSNISIFTGGVKVVANKAAITSAAGSSFSNVTVYVLTGEGSSGATSTSSTGTYAVIYSTDGGSGQGGCVQAQ